MPRQNSRLRIISGNTLTICLGVAVALFVALFLVSVAAEPRGGDHLILSSWPASPTASFPPWRAAAEHWIGADSYNGFGKDVVLALVFDTSTKTSFECWSERTGWPFAAFRMHRFRTLVDTT